MKLKLFLCLIICLITFGCNNDSVVEAIENQPESVVLQKPSTEFFIQGQKLNWYGVNAKSASFTRSSTYSWPYVSNEGWETARFSIRSDGKFPGYIDQSSTKYYGRPAGKQGNNRGRVSGIYNYGRYNDRDYDYYENNKKTGQNIGLFRYLYDENGMKTQLAILEAPSVLDILSDEAYDLEVAISKNQNVSKNQKTLNDVNSLIEKGEEYLNRHTLWYVVKEVAKKSAWHVNGVIVDYEVPLYTVNTNIPDNVEVDIHQQIHSDWNEIKTSVHIRTACESVKINIPLSYNDIIEKDDFDIRVFNFYYKEYEISNKITHNNDGITIEINNIPEDIIKELKDNYGDGLTVEIHSYCTKNDIWEQLSKSCVVETGKPCTVNGQITTALEPSKIEAIKVMNP